MSRLFLVLLLCVSMNGFAYQGGVFLSPSDPFPLMQIQFVRVIGQTSQEITICSGTLVKSNAVLTAAHCLHKLYLDQHDRTKVRNFVRLRYFGKREFVAVQEVELPPEKIAEWNSLEAGQKPRSSCKTSDLGLIILARAVSLPISRIDFEPVEPGEPVVVTGAGETRVQEDYGEIKNEVAKADQKRILRKRGYCLQLGTRSAGVSGLFDAVNLSSPVNKGEVNSRTLAGDSGAPVYRRDRDGHWKIVAVESHGDTNPWWLLSFDYVSQVSPWLKATLSFKTAKDD